ncbi:MAG: hypothetical protein HOQ05_02660 [Corynebacteriales bacterium]|nr:hypothetical protein [Mycobacteriales bacterium]
MRHIPQHAAPHIPTLTSKPAARKRCLEPADSVVGGETVVGREVLCTAVARRFLGCMVKLNIDRPYGSTHPVHGFIFHANFGYVRNFETPKGDELRAYYLGENVSLEVVTGECIAIIYGAEDKSDEGKLIVVPPGMELSNRAIVAAVAFQEIHGVVVSRG